MPVAGWCRQCGAYVWVDQAWACPAGHPASEVSNHYDPDTGAAVAPPWQQPAAPAVAPQPAAPQPPAPQPAPAPTPAPAASGVATREALLAAILAAVSAYPGYNAHYGTETDIVLDNQVADMDWGTGAKKVQFEAAMKAVEQEHTLYYWEVLKESGGGVSFGGFEGESYSTFGGKRWGKTAETVIGPGGTQSFSWDYAQTRRIVEATAAQLGWRTKTVLRKSSAKW